MKIINKSCVLLILLLGVFQGRAQERITLEDAFHTYSYRGIGFESGVGYVSEVPIGVAAEYYGLTHGLEMHETVLYNNWYFSLVLHFLGSRLRNDFVYHLDMEEGPRDVLVGKGSKMSGPAILGQVKYSLFENKRFSAGPFIGGGYRNCFPYDVEDQYLDPISEKTRSLCFEAGVQVSMKHLLFVFDVNELQGTSLSLSMSVAKNFSPALNNWSLNFSLLYFLQYRTVVQKR